MKIVVLGSMTFSKEMIETKKVLENFGQTVYISEFTEEYSELSKDQLRLRVVNNKNSKDGLRELCSSIEKSNAVLALNYDKKGIKNYIGGNTFLELGYAFFLNKQVYLLNPILEMGYKDELVAMKPVILNGDLFVLAREKSLS